MKGIVNVLKPPGMTSHDVVDVVRRLTGLRQVGHTGTLDPAAAGVLPVCVGKATRIVPYLQEAEKAYRAEMTLGVATDTQDAGGQTTGVRVDFAFPASRLDEVMAGFIGTIEQVPPMTSAVRVAGERLYELARRGVEVERPRRTVEIYDLRIVALFPDEPECRFGTRVLFDVVCSKGTYIRTLCADIGERLGCGAHNSFLVRTQSGPFRLEEAVTLEELQRAAAERRIEEFLVPVEAGLAHLAAVRADESEIARLAQGQALPVSGRGIPPSIEPGEHVRVLGPDGRIACIARVEAARPGTWRIQPVRLLM